MQKTAYSVYYRLNNSMPNLKCANLNDRFTVSPDNGNGDLTYPIGLITGDEIMYAGNNRVAANSEFYLYNGSNYWGMTPIYSAAGDVNIIIFNYEGYLYYNSTSLNTVRPVISLKASAITGGSGTASDPFTVG